MRWLRNLKDVPPGEFYYQQSEGIAKSFDASPLIGDTASRVSAFREANSLPRAGLRECLEDIIIFTVNRLPAKSEWIYETDQSIDSLLPSTSGGGGCAGCGAKL